MRSPQHAIPYRPTSWLRWARSAARQATLTGTSARWSAIVFQRLAGQAAQAILGRVAAAVGGELSPGAFAAVPDETPRAAGLSANKLASLPDLSAKVGNSTLGLTTSSRRSDDETIASLVTVRATGRRTAEMYLMFELRRLDVWPVDDFGVRQGYGLTWGLDPPPTAKEMALLGEPFRPYPSIVARYCREAVALFRGGTDPSLRKPTAAPERDTLR